MTTINDELVSNLNLLGLKKDQALVYLAVLELGPSRVWDIAKKSGLKRPTCYLILDELAKMGFASKTQEKKHVEYTVSSPKELLRVFDEKKRVFSQGLHELNTLAIKSKEKPSIRLLEGIAGVKEAYNLTLELPRGAEILFYSRDDIELKYPDFFHEYLQERVKLGIKARGIFPDSVALMQSLPPRDQLELRRSRFIPKNIYDPAADTTVFENTIIQIAYSEKEPFATVIESPALAHDEKQKFELLWELSEVPRLIEKEKRMS